MIFVVSKSSERRIFNTSPLPCSTVANIPILVPQRLLLISFKEAFLDEIAISTPTFSNKLAFAILETLEITRVTPICFTNKEHRRFFSSLLVTLTTTSQEPMSSSLSNSKSVPSP